MHFGDTLPHPTGPLPVTNYFSTLQNPAFNNLQNDRQSVIYRRWIIPQRSADIIARNLENPASSLFVPPPTSHSSSRHKPKSPPRRRREESIFDQPRGAHTTSSVEAEEDIINHSRPRASLVANRRKDGDVQRSKGAECVAVSAGTECHSRPGPACCGRGIRHGG